MVNPFILASSALWRGREGSTPTSPESFLTFLLSISLIHLEFYNKQQEEARLHLQHFAGPSPPLNLQVHSLLVLLFTQKTLLWEQGSIKLCAATQQGSPSLRFPGIGSSFPSESSLKHL